MNRTSNFGGPVMNEMIWSMKTIKIGVLSVVGLALMLLLAACSGDDPGQNSLPARLTSDQVASLAREASFYPNQGSTYGIKATGVGVVEGRSDIAIISLGVETFAVTVSAARREAATAMDSMITVLLAAGVDNEDIETRYFNIQPEYTYGQVTSTLENGQKFTRSERTLTGYRVTNTLSVTIRDLNSTGTIVDTVAEAGGNATRLNNISFTVDGSSALEAQARELALKDAVAKADLYASITGVERGKLVTIVESSGANYPPVARAESLGKAFDSSSPATQIFAGDFQVRVTVQAVFSIK